MTFLNPILAVVGLVCVGIPILIHILMRRRRKPVPWAAMRFLLEAYQQQRRRLRFEQWLLLAARCLLVALIALALGRPVVGSILGGAERGSVTLYLLLDNSLASAATDAAGVSALDRHREQALRLLDELDPAAGDRAAIITLASPARAPILPPTIDLQGARQLVRALTPTDAAPDLSAAVALLRADQPTTDPTAARPIAAILSDFRAGSLPVASTSTPPTTDAPATGPQAPLILATQPDQAALPNTAITALQQQRAVMVVSTAAGSASALAQTPVRVALARSGDTLPEANTRVRLALVLDATPPRTLPVGEIPLRWRAGQRDAIAAGVIDPALALTRANLSASGPVILQAAIDDDALNPDNTFQKPIELRPQLRVGLIWRQRPQRPGLDAFDPAQWVRLALNTAEQQIETIDLDPAALDAPRLAALDAAIVLRPDLIPDESWTRLRAMVDAGALLLLAPPDGVQVNLWPDAASRALAIPWSIPREPRILSAPLGLSPTRELDPAADLLSVFSSELPELARAVSVQRVLAPADPAGSTVLLALSDGTPLLLAATPAPPATLTTTTSPIGRSSPSTGLVVLMTAAPTLDWTDLPAKPLMVPLMQELVRQGVSRARGLSTHTAGKPVLAPPRAAELRPLAAGEPIRLAATTAPALDRAGPYRALDERGSTLALLAINPDTAASNLDPQPQDAVRATLASALGLRSTDDLRWIEPQSPGVRVAGSIRQARHADQGATRLVIALLVAAIALGVLELALSRWFGHATIPKPAPAGARP